MLVEDSTTWSTKVAGISSEVTILGLPRSCPRHPPPRSLTLTPLALALPLFPMFPSIAPSRRAHLLPFSAKALIANSKTAREEFALEMNQSEYSGN